VVRGTENTICVVANVFCFLSNKETSLNAVIGVMREKLADRTNDLI
jgi:hypothetical protein